FCDSNHICYICRMNTDCKSCPFNTRAAHTLSDSGFNQLSENHAVVNFVKGDSIIKQGTFSTNVAFLRTGLVKLHIPLLPSLIVRYALSM
ncbi:MAG: Transcriptional Regulator Crp/Fnr Family, partial [Bacteroidetes bacterium]|nr:Transcriptional Regulator Crp/Fnr Family [Bacteroidota bacterium]